MIERSRDQLLTYVWEKSRDIMSNDALNEDGQSQIDPHIRHNLDAKHQSRD